MFRRGVERGLCPPQCVMIYLLEDFSLGVQPPNIIAEQKHALNPRAGLTSEYGRNFSSTSEHTHLNTASNFRMHHPRRQSTFGGMFIYAQNASQCES